MRALQQRRRQLDPQALSLVRSARRRAKQHAGPFARGGPIGHLVEARVFCSTRAATSAQRDTVPYETRWTGDCSLFTGVFYGDGLGLRTSRRRPVRGRLGFGGERGRRAARYGLHNVAVPHPRCRWGRAPRTFHVPAHRARAGLRHGQQLCLARRRPAWARGHGGQHVSMGGRVARRLMRD